LQELIRRGFYKPDKTKSPQGDWTLRACARAGRLFVLIFYVENGKRLSV
jgi:hypothetical protein